MKSIYKEFFKYASLNVVGMLGISCYILADTFFIAQGIGANGLTSLSIAIPMYSLIYGFGLMFGMGGGTKYSVLCSKSKDKEANKVFSNTVFIGVFVALIFVFSGIFFSDKLSLLLGANDEVFEMTNTYLSIILLFAPAFILNEILLVFVRNDFSPKLCSAAMIIGSLSNIVLDYIFIFPLKMGIFGAALATGVSPIIGILILSIHFLKPSSNLALKICKPSVKLNLNIITIGFSSFVNELSSGIVVIVFNTLMLKYIGNIGVAAYSVIANISIVVTAVFTGIAQGAQPILSRNYGLSNKKNISKILSVAIASVSVLSIIVYVGLFLMKTNIVYAFNGENNAILQSLSENGIALYFTSCIFVGLNIVFTIYFSSLEKAKQSGFISILRGFIVIIPTSIVLSHYFGVTGLWVSLAVSEFIVFIISILLVTLKNKKAE